MSTDSENKLLDSILISLIILTLCIIILGTLISKFSKKSNNQKKENFYEAEKGQAWNLTPPIDTNEVSYYEIGRLRITTEKEKDEEESPAILVISPWLEYPKEDSVFYEEIARKVPMVKGILQSYFSSKTRKTLLGESEEKIKEELLLELNAQFSLGKISNIYFTDYIFLN